MARKSTTSNRQRGLPNQSLDPLLSGPILRPAPVLLPLPPIPAVVAEVGDRRLWQPDRSTRPPHAARPGASRVVAGRTFNATRFADPRFVSICAKRKIRREVLFARGKTKKGARARRRRNFWSAVSC